MIVRQTTPQVRMYFHRGDSWYCTSTPYTPYMSSWPLMLYNMRRFRRSVVQRNSRVSPATIISPTPHLLYSKSASDMMISPSGMVICDVVDLRKEDWLQPCRAPLPPISKSAPRPLQSQRQKVPSTGFSGDLDELNTLAYCWRGHKTEEK